VIICYDCQIEIKTNKTCNDGESRCKKCAHRIRCNKYNKSSYGKEKKQAYTEAHREENCTRAKAWYHENKEQYRATKRAYKKTSEKWKTANSEYKKKRYWADPDYYRAKAKARIHGITPDLIKHVIGQPCNLCGSTENITVDHIHPVSKGGKSMSENLQPLCNPCNAFKNNRLFLPGGGMMVV